jgi:hypothetical protein
LSINYIEIAAVIIIALVAFFIWRKYFRGKRAEALRYLAQMLDFTFSPKSDEMLLAKLSGFQLFSKGHSRKISNVLSGKFNEISVTVMDFQYTTGSGDDTHTYQQTVFYMESEKLLLPGFTLRPEGLFDKITNVFGYKDIDFEFYPIFSKKYFLRGKDEGLIRNTFTDSIIQYYEQHPGISTEGEGNKIIYYSGSKIVPADQIQQLIQQGYELFELFRYNK